MSEPAGTTRSEFTGRVDGSIVLSAVQLHPQVIPSVPAGAEIVSVSGNASSRTDEPAVVAAWRCGRVLGGCPDGGLQIRLLLDESGSVTSHADPIAFRHVMLARALDALAGCCGCGQCSVELLTFGRRNDLDVQSTGAARLTQAGLSPVRALLASPPMTGSKLGGAVGQVLQRTTSGTAVALVVSDFQLFDPDPAALYQQLATIGPGIAAVLRTDPLPADLSSSGLRVIQVSATSSPTLLADTLIDLIADNRGPLPPPGPPAELAGPPPVAPSPTDPPARPIARSPRRARWWWLVPLLIAVLLAALAIHGLTTHSAGTAGGGGLPIPGQLSPGQALPTVSGQQPTTTAPSLQLAPITLPPPQGTATRTVPAATVWIVDPDVAAVSGAQQAIVEEAPIALGYQQRYGLSSDRIALSPGGALASPDDQASVLDTHVGLLSPALTRVGSQPASALQSAQDELTQLATPADRIVVILTADPARWSALLPSATYAHPPTGQPHPEIRYYLIPLSSAASPNTLELTTTGPHVIAADPASRGQLAIALARSFVDGTDATWPQN